MTTYNTKSKNNSWNLKLTVERYYLQDSLSVYIYYLNLMAVIGFVSILNTY